MKFEGKEGKLITIPIGVMFCPFDGGDVIIKTIRDGLYPKPNPKVKWVVVSIEEKTLGLCMKIVKFDRIEDGIIKPHSQKTVVFQHSPDIQLLTKEPRGSIFNSWIKLDKIEIKQ